MLVLAVPTVAVVTPSTDARTPVPRRLSRRPFTVVEATIPEMQAAMTSGRVTSREIVRQYLVRIATYEDRLHAAITVNPKALELAAERDRERAAGKIRGPLHGIPVALKDNVQTTFMRTTGGALAFENLVPPYDATLTKNLIDAGAIIIAKTGMTELANWVAGAPTPMPANYNAVGGQGYNPYDPRKDPRDATFDGRPALQTGGSSSGIGTTRISGRPTSAPKRRGPFSARRIRTCSAGYQADGRPHQPARRHSDYRRSGHRGSDGQERERRRDHVRRARKPVTRSERSGDRTLHAGARAGLHTIPQEGRPEGRAHRYSARVLLRRVHAR